MESVFIGDGHAHINLRNRGSGVAKHIRVTFTGSAAEAHVAKVEPGRSADAPEMRLADAPFFHEELAAPPSFW